MTRPRLPLRWFTPRALLAFAHFVLSWAISALPFGPSPGMHPTFHSPDQGRLNPSASAGYRDDNPLHTTDLGQATRRTGIELKSIFRKYDSITDSALIKEVARVDWENPNQRLSVKQYMAGLGLVGASDLLTTKATPTTEDAAAAHDLGGFVEALGEVADLADGYQLRRDEIESLESAWGELIVKLPTSSEPETTREFIGSIRSDLDARSANSDSTAAWLKANGYEEFGAVVERAVDQVVVKRSAQPEAETIWTTNSGWLESHPGEARHER